MKQSSKNRLSTGVWLGVAGMNSVIAYNHAEAATTQEATSVVYKSIGNRALADFYQEQADDSEESRNLYGGLVVLNLTIAGLYGIQAARNRREEEQAVLQDQAPDQSA